MLVAACLILTLAAPKDEFAFLERFHPVRKVTKITFTSPSTFLIFRARRTTLLFKSPVEEVRKAGMESGSPLFPRNRPHSKELFSSAFWPMPSNSHGYTCGLEVIEPTEQPPKPIGKDRVWEKVMKHGKPH